MKDIVERSSRGGFKAMNHPTVDVIIPVYNGADYVADAIESALNQDVPPRRVIVVDDGSTDSTAAVARRFGSQVFVVRHDTNRGLPAARNTGINHSDADLLAFLDADDAWTTDKLRKQIVTFEKDPGIGLCYAGYTRCDMALKQIGKPKTLRARHGEWVFRELYLDGFPMAGGSTVVVRREVFHTCGMFDESMLKAQDFECWLRISMRYPVSCVPEPLCRIRVNPTSITGMSGAEKKVYYSLRAFDLCAEAAAKWGIALPMPVQDRKRLELKRRCHKALEIGRNDWAAVYRKLWQEMGQISLRDRLALRIRQGKTAVKNRLKSWIGLPG